MADQPVEHEKLLAFVNGTLDPEEARALNERMSHDEELRQQVAALIESQNTPTPPPFPGMQDQAEGPAAATPEASEKPWQRFLASIKGQTKTQSRLAALAIGSLVAAAVSGLVFLIYLNQHLGTLPAPTAAEQNAEASPPAAEAPAAAEAEALPQDGAAPTTVPETDAAATPAETASAPSPESAPVAEAQAPEPAPAQAPAATLPAAPVPEQAAPPAAAEEPQPAAKGTAPAGGRFAVLAKDCSVHAEPEESSKAINQLSQGQRLWTEPADQAGWKKVYRKKGVAFVQNECFAPGAPKTPAASKPAKPARESKAKNNDPLRDEATELSDESTAAAAPLEAPHKGGYYMTLLARGETKLDGSTNSARLLGALAEHLDGNTNCLPLSIPAEKLGDSITLHLKVKADGTIRSLRIEPKIASGDKVVTCFKSRLAGDKSALAGGKDASWSVVLRVQ